MPDHARIRALRGDWDHLQATITRLGLEVREVDERLEAASRAGDADAAAAERETRDQRRRARRDARQEQAGIVSEIERLRDDFDPALFPDLADRISGLAADRPVALLPVRIETRFLPHSDGAPTQLWIRIYPDDLHVDAHEPELTEIELTAAEIYWGEVEAAGDDGERVDAAWARLADGFEAPRAEWIIRSTRPGPGGGLARDQVPRKEGDWTRAPLVRALPERFVALGYVGQSKVFTEWGEHVPDRLPAGPEPDPDADDREERLGPAPADQPELAIDEGMGWLVDLHEAQRIGMAIAVDLQPAFAAGLDRLVVLGVRAADEPADGSQLVEELLAAQRFTDGLSVLRPGAATNNTDTERSAMTSQRPRRDPLRPAGAGAGAGAGTSGTGGTGAARATVGAETALALGLDPAALDGVEGAERIDQLGAMHAALWPATLGYYAEQLLLPSLTDRDVDGLRHHVSEWLRGRGPLPVLRAGNQPYGLLPVMVRGRIGRRSGDISRPLERFLDSIRGFWVDAVGRTPRLGRTGDEVRDLVEVLGQAAVTTSLEGRPVIGRHLLENLLRHGVKSPVPEVGMEAHRATAEMLLNVVGIDDRTIRMASLTAVDATYPIRRPFVGRGPLSETKPAPFVSAVAAQLGRADTVRRLRSLPRATSVLELLLRHAGLMAMGSVATSLNLVARGRPSRVLMEAEFLDVELDEGATATALRLIDRPVAQVTGDRTVAEVIESGDDGLAFHLGPWQEFREGVERLVDVPAAELHRMFVDLLDVLSHRLDAWYTSIAARRLELVRSTAPSGVHVGAFGFVEDLRPDRPEVVEVDDDGGLVAELSSNEGYVHAPSMWHASTAAILRSGYLAGGGRADDVLAVDLSSARVRRAVEVIRGVRGGELLGAVLGYRIERALRERELGQYIRPLRVAAPLVVDVTGRGDATGAVIGGSVVDGERVVELHESGALFGAGAAPFPATDPNRQAVEGVVSEVADVVDALADVLLAEAVHQTVAGDPARASAALAAIDHGVSPPDPDVVRTTRTGVGLTHRVAVLFDPNRGTAPGWPATARSVAEPGLDRWVGTVLGPPSRYRIDVVYRDDDGVELAREAFTLDEVGVGALDVTSGLPPGTQGGASELEARLVRHAASLRSGNPELVRTAAAPADPGPPSGSGLASLDELAALAEQLSSLIVHSRKAESADLMSPDDGAGSPDPLVEALRQRMGEVEAGFRAAAGSLFEAAAGGDPSAIDPSAIDPFAIDTAAAALADFGLPGSLVDGPAAVAAAHRIVDALDGAGVDDASVGELIDRIELIFSGTVTVVAPFPAANHAELEASRSQSAQLQGGDLLAAAGFLVRSGAVREGCERMSRIVLLAEALLGADPADELAVVQLPHEAEARWIGLEFVDDLVPTASLAIVVHDPDRVDFESPIAGLVVDEWNEIVPRGGQITGVSFHYDQPDATAPNAILLGVHPGDADQWDLATLEATVLESIELAKLRAVDTDDLQWVGRFLPMLFFPDNLAGDTAAVDLLSMAIREGG